MTVALEGPLKEFHIQDVFQLLDLGRKSGVLRVTSELRQTAGTVSFERGGVVAATLGNDPQPIGARLVRLGKISATTAPARLGRCSTRVTPAGSATFSSPTARSRGASSTASSRPRSRKPSSSCWAGPKATSASRTAPPSKAVVEAPVRIPTEGLLMEAARRSDEWSRIEDKVPHLRVIPRLPPADAAGADGSI